MIEKFRGGTIYLPAWGALEHKDGPEANEVILLLCWLFSSPKPSAGEKDFSRLHTYTVIHAHIAT
jgi:hypothetical protein